MSNLTHCVTFKYGTDKFWAVRPKTRGYRDAMPEGVNPPQLRCALTEKEAATIAQLCIDSKFTDVKICELKIKPRKRN